MNISEIIQNNVQKVMGEVTSIFSYKEYVDTQLEDFASVVSEGKRGIFEIADSTKTLYDISSQEYLDCLNGVVDEIELTVHGTSDKVLFTADAVCNAVEELMSEARCQSEFLSMCINGFNKQISSVDYVSLLSSKFPSISSGSYTKFEKILANGLTGKESLISFITCMSNSVISEEDYGTQVVNYEGFSDSIAYVTALKIWEDISTGLTKLGDSIRAIIGFFKTLADKVIEFGSWILGVTSVNLSRYEFDHYSDIGHLDFPIIQIPFYDLLGSQQQLKEHFPWNYCGYPWNGKRYVFMYDRIDLDWTWRSILKTEWDDIFPSGTVDVIVSSKPFSMLIRLGSTKQSGGWIDHTLSVYPIISKEDVRGLSDEDIIDKISQSVRGMLMNVSECIPFVGDNQLNSSDVDGMWDTYTNLVISKDNQYPDDLFRAVNHKMVNINSIYEIISDPKNVPNRCQIFTALLVYVGITTRGEIFSMDQYARPLGWYLLPYSGSEIIGDDLLESVDPCVDYSVNYTGTFSPYVKQNLIPISCHYQSPAEQAQDIINFLRVIVISGFAIVAIMALTTSLKNSRIEKELAQANVDRLSWEVGEHPTLENLNAFLKARKKNNRLHFISSLFGVATRNDDLGILLRSVLPALNPGESLSALRRIITGNNS